MNTQFLNFLSACGANMAKCSLPLMYMYRLVLSMFRLALSNSWMTCYHNMTNYTWLMMCL
jgi:hypothetical protein